MSSEITPEMRVQAYRICRDYLHGAWKTIGSDDMVIKHISGGLSNLLYYCALPSTTLPTGHEPAEVLVRFYGQVHGEGALESLLAESVIFTLLSERRLGPRLYGVFPEGRLEQYIPARSLTTEELGNPQISRQIAIRMAKIHALNVPISKEPTWYWNCLKRWLKSSDEFLHTSTSPESPLKSVHLEKLRQIDYEEELAHIRRLITRIQSPVVFAHNDMQEGNILISSNSSRMSERISLIDFEYCSYNYRGFDLANHFCEWVYSYKKKEEPFFTYDIGAFPSRQQQLNFIRVYLSAYEIACGRKTTSPSACENGILGSVRKYESVQPSRNSSHSSHSNDSDQEESENKDPPPRSHPAEEKLLQEVRVFTLASHIFWSLWSIVQAHVSKIPFGYLEYALVRIEHYNECKRNLKNEDIAKRKVDQLSSKD